MTKMTPARSDRADGLPARDTQELVFGKPELLYKGFFKLHRYAVRHRLRTGPKAGSLSEPQNVEVFERGDAVGVLLYNRKEHKVVVVRQFRLPAVDLLEPALTGAAAVASKSTEQSNGWIIETVAGMIGRIKDASGNVIRDETPEETAIRETMEETGYLIERPELVASYFSSPGGTSERIYLFFAFISDDKKPEAGGGKIDPKTGLRTEDIEVLPLTVDDFSTMLRQRELVDPKLLIAAYYLQARLGLRIETGSLIEPGKQRELAPYYWTHRKDIAIDFKTGDILNVKGVDIWLNPENKYMMMARVFDNTLSASIRWGGAEKYSNDIVAVDVIGNALRTKMGHRTEVHDFEIIETEPGHLGSSLQNGVKRILHLPISEAVSGPRKAGFGLKVDPTKIARTFYKALCHAHETNAKIGRRLTNWVTMGRLGKPCTSVLVPLVGTGLGHLTAREAVPYIVEGISMFLNEYGKITDISRIYLLAHSKRDLDDCQFVLDQHSDFIELQAVPSGTSANAPVAGGN